MSLVAAFFDSEFAEGECYLAAAAVAVPQSLRGEHRCCIGGQDADIAWELAGPSDAPLLIVAGGRQQDRHVCSNDLDGTPGWWQTQAALLARFRLLSINWLEGDADTVQQADAIAAVCKVLALPRAHAFVGASYGALVGLQFAARHGEHTARLVSISGAHQACAVQWAAEGCDVAGHQVEPEKIRIPLTIIAAQGDTLAPCQTLAELAVRAPDAWLQKITSLHGHQAYLYETTAIAAAINTALDD